MNTINIKQFIIFPLSLTSNQLNNYEVISCFKKTSLFFYKKKKKIVFIALIFVVLQLNLYLLVVVSIIFISN